MAGAASAEASPGRSVDTGEKAVPAIGIFRGGGGDSQGGTASRQACSLKVGASQGLEGKEVVGVKKISGRLMVVSGTIQLRAVGRRFVTQCVIE